MSIDAAIRPFQLDVPQAAVDDLKGRITNTRWPSEAPVAGWERGVPLGHLRQLAGYWAEVFDWRRHEGELNELGQFVTTVDDQEVHFLHIRSPEPDALPLILTHGWPSSPVEFLKVIPSLSDPGFHGGDPADAFHLVPLSSNSWTQAADQVDQLVGIVEYTHSAECLGYSASLTVLQSVNGGDATPIGGAYLYGGSRTHGIDFYPHPSRFEPGSAAENTLTASVQSSCPAGQQTIDSLKIDVIAAR